MLFQDINRWVQEFLAKIQDTISRIQVSITLSQNITVQIQDMTCRLKKTLSAIQDSIARIQDSIALIQDTIAHIHDAIAQSQRQWADSRSHQVIPGNRCTQIQDTYECQWLQESTRWIFYRYLVLDCQRFMPEMVTCDSNKPSDGNQCSTILYFTTEPKYHKCIQNKLKQIVLVATCYYM
jgi:hypothetical protein